MTITREMRESVARLEREVETILVEAMETAKQSGKPLTILAGESHYSLNSALVQLVVYRVAHKLGIRDIAFELPRDDPDYALAGPLTEIRRNFPTGHNLVGKLAIYHNDNTHLIDDCHTMGNQPDGGTDARNENMAANLNPWQRPVLMLTGLYHLPGLKTEMERYDTHHLVRLKTAQEARHSLMVVSSTDDILTILKNDTHALQLGFDPSDLSMNEVLALGMGEAEADRFIEWAEKNGHKFSSTTARAWIQELEGKDPAHMQGEDYFRYAKALCELGRYAEAGKYYAHAIRQEKGPGHCTDPMEDVDQVRFNATFKRAYAEQMGVFAAAEKAAEIAPDEELPIPLLHIKKPASAEISVPYAPR